MASPHVAGVAALIVSSGVKDPKKVEEILRKTATKKEDKNKYGAGILNAAAAVKAAQTGDFTVVDAQETSEPDQPSSASETGKIQAQETLKKPSPIKFKESMLYFLAGTGFALLYFKLLKRADGWGKIFSFLFTLAMFLTSPGLFFIDSLPIPFVPRPVIHFLSSPIPNLDRVLLGHTTASLNPIFHSVLLPLILVITLLNLRHWKAFAMGVAVGMTAHLFVDAFLSLADVTVVPNFFLDKLWLILNGALCFGLALLAGKKS
jgi:serine protease